ncbi:polyribonucleotide 5'-hydroxyl-kinase Clp1-like [Varroa jacobsoni]|uniref:Protein CLP1 homolog n=1 Tax=Varroa destructor TaxID=109461 RepID=A0A7M7JV19_VARDE|nr:polyribonucleotide 5'-hydroxyl-kinase Clp1-like [Varroa destructor]XP_022706471.1 polyribonucleotide 5'-hydroxyl-kinase Clp1-like [Varroa jacobsoni]
MAVDVEPKQDYKLDKENELRFEVEPPHKVKLELVEGSAEIFGAEIVKDKQYIFSPGCKVAVFTWYGCTLRIIGITEVAYVSKETPMVVYANIHAVLEQMRQKAEIKGTKGPTVMMVGPTDVGKSTLCKLLLNYAVRQGKRPMFVELDVGQGQISIPGTVGAILVERPSDIEEGFSQQGPLVFHFGHISPGQNIELYNTLITRLAEVLQKRADVNKKVAQTGTIINTCGWVKQGGYKALLHAAVAFEVDVVLVMDQERLYNELVRDLPKFISVVLTPKSGGVVERTKRNRLEAREAAVKQYFYGLKTTLYPHSFDVKFSDIKVFKIGAPALPDSCMPLGMKVDDNRTKLVEVQNPASLLHHILSVSFAVSADEDTILSNVAGFVCVTNVDLERGTLTVLSPQPRPLPKSVLLVSDIQFVDSVH